MSSLAKLTIRDCEYVLDGSDYVYHVSSSHALIQAAGYLKFMSEPYERVFFRGQSKLHGCLSPSIYRGLSSLSTRDKKHGILKKVINEFTSQCEIFKKIPDYSWEPLLQHYGIKTTWLDVVDNVWVALWFSVYKPFTAGNYSEFLHFDLRSGENEFCYIMLVKVDENRKIKTKKGLFQGNKYEYIDLRMCVPSIFVRPHAQHGLLFRSKSSVSNGRDLDYSSSIAGILRFKLSDGISWLGNGAIHGIRSLFPPPYFDEGYKMLLSCQLSDRSLGSVHHIGA